MGKITTVLNERDIRIFDLIKKFGWLREDFLSRYLGFNWGDIKVKNNMNSLAYRLSKDEFIVKRKIIEGYPSYWKLGKSGADFMSCVVEKDIALMTLRHNDLVADLATDWLFKNKENKNSNLTTELELKRELFGAEAKKKKLPDLVIDGKIAIEVEISKKPDARLAVIIANYLTSSYEHVVYYTNSKSIADRVHKLAKGHKKFSYFVFQNTNILEAQEYSPIGNSVANEPVRNEQGQFQSNYDKKLEDLGFV